MTRFTRLNNNAVNKLTVPLFSSGINSKDGVSYIGDNQLCDAENVWFDGTALKTRPKIGQVSQQFYDRHLTPDEILASIKTNYRWYSKGELKEGICNCVAAVSKQPAVNTGALHVFVDLYAFLLDDSENTAAAVSSFEFEVVTEETKYIKANAFRGIGTTDSSNGIYIILATYDDEQCKNITECRVFESVYISSTERNILKMLFDYQKVGDKVEITVDDMYHPLIYLNGKGNRFSSIPINSETEYAPASSYEGKNLLPGGCRLQFSTDGYSNMFKMPVAVDENNAKITVNFSGMGIASIEKKRKNEWYYINNTQVLDFSFSNNSLSEEEYRLNGSFEILSKGGDGSFTFCEVNLEDTVIRGCFENNTFSVCSQNNSKLILPASAVNNIEALCYIEPLKYFDKLLEMKVNCLYGGGAGAYGGSRAFLAGYKNFFCYSSSVIGKGSYFSENSFVGVGDNSSITALSQMTGDLIIFKKNSVYATNTVTGENVSAEQVQSGAVSDITTTFVYFPIYQLSGDIGCDIPKSVQLCLDRLVFASTSGEVYCIVTKNNNLQKNIYPIGGEIRKKMFDKNGCLLKKDAFSVCYKEHYLLFCEGNVFLLNYNTNSYRYAGSYSNLPGTYHSKQFTWWFWKTEKFTEGFCLNGSLILFNFENKQYGDYSLFTVSKYFVSDEMTEDNFTSMIDTKIFDFSLPERYKLVEKLFLNIKAERDSEIMLTVHTDNKDEIYGPVVFKNGELIKLSGKKKCKRIGVKLQSDKAVSIENLEFYYKVLGEVMS